MRKRQSITPPSSIASRLKKPAVGPAFGSIMLSALFEHDLFGKPVSTFPDHAQQIKRKRNASRRIVANDPHQRMRLAQRRQVYAVCAHKIHAARSPDGVPPRHLLQRANAATQLQNALPGTRLPAGVTRRPLSQSSDKVADRSSCRPGVFPLAARERR